MIILSRKQKKSETNIHLNIKVINKGPSENFFGSKDLLISFSVHVACFKSPSPSSSQFAC